ncbi:MAG: class I SAM-dependent methyltransferase [Spirochaetales bacterium]|nr:class I SAM-dependent methyltransferase [Spirochaetales bacterium]
MLRHSSAKETGCGNFELLDCGNGRRLERVGDSLFIRQAPQAEFAPALPELWDGCDYVFNKDSLWNSADSEALPDFEYGNLKMELRLSENGQIGIYPEQKVNWDWLISRIGSDEREHSILNGFAYTGASTLAAASAVRKGQVCHLDASKAAVNWARSNRERSSLPEESVRFIVDDISVFLEREIRRDKRYTGLILDPPAFGRAKGGKTWRLKRDLPRLMKLASGVMADDPSFLLLSCHDPEITKSDLAGYCASVLKVSSREIETLDLEIPAEKGNSLSNGIAARWYRTLK